MFPENIAVKGYLTWRLILCVNTTKDPQFKGSLSTKWDFPLQFTWTVKKKKPKSGLKERKFPRWSNNESQGESRLLQRNAKERCKNSVQEQLSFLVAPGLNWIWEKNWMLQACHLQFYWIFYRDYWIFCNHPLDWQVKDTLIKLLETQSWGGNCLLFGRKKWECK